MSDYRLNQLQEALIADDTDIFHLRTTGGLDKKITGQNLRKTTGAIVLSYSTTQTVNLAGYSADVVILCDTSGGGAWTLTFSSTLTAGRRVTIVCSGGDNLTVSYTASGGSHSFIMKDTEEVQLLSNGSNLLAVKGNIRLWVGNVNSVTEATIFGNSGLSKYTGLLYMVVSNTIGTDKGLNVMGFSDSATGGDYYPAENESVSVSGSVSHTGTTFTCNAGTSWRFREIRMAL